MLTVKTVLAQSPDEVLAFLREQALPILEPSEFKPGDAVTIGQYQGRPQNWCLGDVGIVLMHDPARRQLWVMAVDGGGGAMAVSVPADACSTRA